MLPGGGGGGVKPDIGALKPLGSGGGGGANPPDICVC